MLPFAMDALPLMTMDVSVFFASVMVFVDVLVTPPDVYVAVSVAVWSAVVVFWFVTTPDVLTDA